MRRPDRSEEEWIRQHNKIIAAAAWRFSNTAEYDDLYQEGMISVWLMYDKKPHVKTVTAAVYNRMKDWTRYVKRQSRHHGGSYEEVVDGLYNTNDREHA